MSQEPDPERGARFQRVCSYIFGESVPKTGIARELGCSEGAVRGWITGENPPNGTVLKLLATFGASEQYILSGGGEMMGRPAPRHINSKMEFHLRSLDSFRRILSGYEREAVRGALTEEEFGSLIEGAVTAVKERHKGMDLDQKLKARKQS